MVTTRRVLTNAAIRAAAKDRATEAAFGQQLTASYGDDSETLSRRHRQEFCELQFAEDTPALRLVWDEAWSEAWARHERQQRGWRQALLFKMRGAA